MGEGDSYGEFDVIGDRAGLHVRPPLTLQCLVQVFNATQQYPRGSVKNSETRQKFGDHRLLHIAIPAEAGSGMYSRSHKFGKLQVARI
jgi:hypothetical protein